MKRASPRLRRILGIAALSIVAMTWASVAIVIFLLPFDKTRFAVSWTVAVLMTEALFWVAVVIGGISAVNRFRFWRRRAHPPSGDGSPESGSRAGDR
ncbi:hypothetical protein [Sphingomonas colocasiae]|uniref:Transporter suffix domain-containing protein n=1 Tax=Sphingomonas colocasiae TaxID=1848973 RepID=A0ABS7PVR7_9SPHN|nr:hypothetical protein [Sphingomonas colocasiae]MBY8825303.1 hypothetical protein [Sphingomonas colocasiae]